MALLKTIPIVFLQRLLSWLEFDVLCWNIDTMDSYMLSTKFAKWLRLHLNHSAD